MLNEKTHSAVVFSSRSRQFESLRHVHYRGSTDLEPISSRSSSRFVCHVFADWPRLLSNQVFQKSSLYFSNLQEDFQITIRHSCRPAKPRRKKLMQNSNSFMVSGLINLAPPSPLHDLWHIDGHSSVCSSNLDKFFFTWFSMPPGVPDSNLKVFWSKLVNWYQIFFLDSSKFTLCSRVCWSGTPAIPTMTARERGWGWWNYIIWVFFEFPTIYWVRDYYPTNEKVAKLSDMKRRLYL